MHEAHKGMLILLGDGCTVNELLYSLWNVWIIYITLARMVSQTSNQPLMAGVM